MSFSISCYSAAAESGLSHKDGVLLLKKIPAAVPSGHSTEREGMGRRGGKEKRGKREREREFVFVMSVRENVCKEGSVL